MRRIDWGGVAIITAIVLGAGWFAFNVVRDTVDTMNATSSRSSSSTDKTLRPAPVYGNDTQLGSSEWDGTNWYDDIAEDAYLLQEEDRLWDQCLGELGSPRDCHLIIYGDDGGWDY